MKKLRRKIQILIKNESQHEQIYRIDYLKKQTKRGEMIESPRRNMLLNLKGVNAN